MEKWKQGAESPQHLPQAGGVKGATVVGLRGDFQARRGNIGHLLVINL